MKALIVASGSPPSKKLIHKHRDAGLLIAADGGIEILKKCGMTPDYLIGDFDSAKGRTVRDYKGRTQVVQFEVEKNETDGMIALKLAIEQGAGSVVMLGALGKRTDHAFANIMLLQYAFDHGVSMIIEDRYCQVCLAKGEFQLHGKAGQTVSILPWMGSCTVTSDDAFHYPLDGLYMAQDDAVGVSNVLTRPAAQLSIQGYALIFKIKRDG